MTHKDRFAAFVGCSLLLSAAFITLMGMTSEQTEARHSTYAIDRRPQCSDGIDNNGNGKIDYPQDSDCESPDDDSEGVSQAGVFVTVTDAHESVMPGGALTYVITLKQQRDDARLMNITFKIPYQGNIVSASDGGSVNPTMVQWTNVSVYKNVTRTLVVNVNVVPGAPVGQYILARANAGGAEATDTTLIEDNVQPSADQYRVSVTDNHEYVLPGENLTYVVKVKNMGNRTQTTDVHLTLPSQVYFVSNSEGGTRSSYNVIWKNVSLSPDEEGMFTATAQVDYRTSDGLIIRAKAYAGTIIDTDQTVVRIGLPYNAIGVSITDNRETAEVGQLLTYIITVRNNATIVGTSVNVDASLPLYGEFVSATEGGTWDGSNVRWLLMQVAPGDTRRLTYTVRVRSDAPQGCTLTASATADGATARDTTTVGAVGSGGREGTVIFRKTADRSEVFPGGKIRYTLTVTNTLDHAVTDAVIVDRYNPSTLGFVSASDPVQLVKNSGGELQWQVPVLEPGKSWQTSYMLEVASDAPASLPLDNIATIKGSDLDGVSLMERVRTNSQGVMGNDVPETGAGMDAILGLALLAVAIGVATTQKKLSLS